jgi:hypothetical protein
MAWLAEYEHNKAGVSSTDKYLAIPEAMSFNYEPQREQEGIQAMSELE